MRPVMRRGLLSLLVLFCVFPSGCVRTLKSIKDLAAPPVALTPSTFTIGAESKQFQFRSSGQHVVGHFIAAGVSKNNIRVFIFDEDGFANWQNGRPVKTHYDSGKVTTGKIDLRLKPGTYYLVFDNSFSGVSNKTITSDIQIQ
jgi:hypothetical protein